MNPSATTSRPRDSLLSRVRDRPGTSSHISDAAPAICRICRGEGTSAEPLFYPCKCSGSIKYVHQDCLMEWLSHSQKKYCELCKTSFRFTKLYAPDMPHSLPVHIFLEHMAKHLVRNLLVWLRAVVTISVWICWLPYFMRVIWAFMFWISDEGLGAGQFMPRLSAKITGVDRDGNDPNRTCPVRTIFDESVSCSDNITFSNSTVAMVSPSLLSDVGFLKNLTRSHTVNRAIVTVIEGQIITVLVIICFVLVILVRDYVVQQQPEINMRAAFADLGHNQPAQAQANNNAAEDEDGHESDALRSDDETLDAEPSPNELSEPQIDPLINNKVPEPNVEDNAGSASKSTDLVADMKTEALESTAPEEVITGLENRASVMEYLRVYRRADGDLERILQIVENEGLEENLGYWVNVTRRSLRERERTSQETSSSAITPEPFRPIISQALAIDLDEFGAAFPDSQQTGQEPSEEISKGKERQWLPISPELSLNTTHDNFDPLPGPSRPRAHSDGPELQTTTNPLANNSWSFANLSRADGADDAGHEWPLSVNNNSLSLSAAIAENEALQRRQVRPDTPQLSDHGNYYDASADTATDAPQIVPNEPDLGIELNQQGLVGRVTNYMWGDLDNHPEVESPQHDAVADGAAADATETVVGADDPWVDDPVAEAAGANDDADANANANVIDAAAAAGMDAEAIEDLEDFEGVMELLGMRGPIAGLFQNAIFCAVLVSVTIFSCIFIPYNIGRISLWIIANPIQLVRMIMGLSKVIQDAVIMVMGFGSWCALNIVDMFTGIVGGAVGAQIVSARKASWSVCTGAGSRVVDYALMEFPMTASEMQNFSAISHKALNSVKDNIGWAANKVDGGLSAVFAWPDLTALFDGRFLASISFNSRSLAAVSGSMFNTITDPAAWVIDLGEMKDHSPVDLSLAYWSGMDRFWAISAGYITLFAIGALYLKRGSPFSRGDMMQAWEAGVIDTLHQASGIMKVILIISIEMLVFPLYCGLLLDGALLPLFENTTFKSRLLFTYNYPLTSIFVHWFVGTGYMFHFALFVSMCRKIMRPGVLYFIRDPDDPEFHPVRDVLERNLTTQLRKILFSAFVYGALVIVCLGGVVWGLYHAMPGVLPIHYSSNEPVLEFPVDLLFYNFVMPLAVKFFKPSDRLHAMYTWWFRKCARGLRLTYFLFGERRIDEEGTLHMRQDMQNGPPTHKSLLLELDEDNKVIPKTWKDTFDGGYAKPNPTVSKREKKELRHKKAQLVHTGQLAKSGRFVRAPASDRVKIPKNQKVFLTVSERGRRKDGKPDTDLYSSDQYQLVYIPPSFRARIFLFILFIWLFAAVTGVSLTIVPLILGRAVFTTLIPAHIRTNDIYAFSIGIYVLGSVAYAILRLGHITAKLKGWTNKVLCEMRIGNIGSRILSGAIHGVKLTYVYFFLVIVFPLVISALMELYVSIPLHTYVNPPKPQRNGIVPLVHEAESGQHTVRVIQSWTLGVLYLNLAIRMIMSLFPDTRAAMAVQLVMRRGYLKPDVGVLTRAFIVPGMMLSSLAIVGPPMLASALIRFGLLGPISTGDGLQAAADSVRTSMIYRHSYPAAAVGALMIKYGIGFTRIFNRWTAGVRDEAYLIGERLHNFGAATAGSRKARRAWGAAGGGRL